MSVVNKKSKVWKKKAIENVLGAICAGQSLRSVCRADDHTPSVTSFLKWVSDEPELAERYARARNIQADLIFDEMASLEEKVLDGQLEPQAYRVAMDTRKWRLGRMMPQKYGDTLKVQSEGSINLVIETPFADGEHEPTA